MLLSAFGGFSELSVTLEPGARKELWQSCWSRSDWKRISVERTRGNLGISLKLSDKIQKELENIEKAHSFIMVNRRNLFADGIQAKRCRHSNLLIPGTLRAHLFGLASIGWSNAAQPAGRPTQSLRVVDVRWQNRPPAAAQRRRHRTSRAGRSSPRPSLPSQEIGSHSTSPPPPSLDKKSSAAQRRCLRTRSRQPFPRPSSLTRGYNVGAAAGYLLGLY